MTEDFELTPDQKAKVLQASGLGLKLKDAAGLARVDPDGLIALVKFDEELELDIREAQSIGMVAVIETMIGNATGAHYWIQRFISGFDYIIDKDKMGRIDADLWRDGAVITFDDVVSGTVYDESKV